MAVLTDYWELVLASLKRTLPKSSYDAWFSQVSFIKSLNNGRKLVLQVPSQFNKSYLQKKFQKQLLESVQRYYPQVIHLSYEISKKDESETTPQESFFPIKENLNGLEESIQKLKSRNLNLNSSSLYSKNIHNLNPKYSLETFVETSSNQLALSVVRAVIEKPGTRYNPVFLYSGVGLGKTHLLQAVGQKILENQPNLKIKYATCEMFFNHFIASIQGKNSSEFREYYRSVDVLLLDDIQFISGKEATQEAFFHAFNELHQNNKQIIITSDRHPKSLGSVEDRLISRFEWGLVIDISTPDFEDRLAVLNYKTEQMGLKLTSSQATQIAEVVNTNFRDLEGVLNRVQARITLLPLKPFEDYELNKILSGYHLGSPIKLEISSFRPQSPEQVIGLVAQIFSIKKEDLMGSSRLQNLVLARQVAMYACKNLLKLSYPAVGKIFSRDHTTIMHASRKITQELEKGNLELRSQVQFVKDNLKG